MISVKEVKPNRGENLKDTVEDSLLGLYFPDVPKNEIITIPNTTSSVSPETHHIDETLKVLNLDPQKEQIEPTEAIQTSIPSYKTTSLSSLYINSSVSVDSNSCSQNSKLYPELPKLEIFYPSYPDTTHNVEHQNLSENSDILPTVVISSELPYNNMDLENQTVSKTSSSHPQNHQLKKEITLAPTPLLSSSTSSYPPIAPNATVATAHTATYRNVTTVNANSSTSAASNNIDSLLVTDLIEENTKLINEIEELKKRLQLLSSSSSITMTSPTLPLPTATLSRSSYSNQNPSDVVVQGIIINPSTNSSHDRNASTVMDRGVGSGSSRNNGTITAARNGQIYTQLPSSAIEEEEDGLEQEGNDGEQTNRTNTATTNSPSSNSTTVTSFSISSITNTAIATTTTTTASPDVKLNKYICCGGCGQWLQAPRQAILVRCSHCEIVNDCSLIEETPLGTRNNSINNNNNRDISNNSSLSSYLTAILQPFQECMGRSLT